VIPAASGGAVVDCLTARFLSFSTKNAEYNQML
jgi:hypothetical protein